MDNIILIDWFSFTSRIHSVSSVLNFLGLEETKNFTQTFGSKGFKDRITYGGLNIHYNNTQDESLLWIEFTGQGCRLFDETSKKDWLDIMFEIVSSDEKSYNITRLDIAYDDRNRMLNLDTIFKEVEKQNYISKFRSWSTINSDKGKTVYIGSVTSDIRLTFYDKARERKREIEGHWIRLEMRLRDEKAVQFIKNINNNLVGDVFTSVINHYLRFVAPSEDSNKQRWKNRKWWNKFINTTKKISLWTKCDREYNLARCEDFVYRQCGSALDTLINIKGLDKVVEELDENKPSEKNIKYINLEKEHKANKGILSFLDERGAL